jgi:hypothetical protein
MRCHAFAAAAGLLLVATPGSASVTLLAKGVLSGTSDLSGLSGSLESGVAANTLGGIGSGLAYAGGNTFVAIPDRGPNAVAYGSNQVDNTTSFIARFHTLDIVLAASAPGSALPFTVTPKLTGTTLLSSPTPLVYGTGAGLGVGSGAPAQNNAGTYYFTGRSDNYNPAASSANPLDGRFDPESVRVSNDGKSVFVSDEYGPYVRQFDRDTGQLVKTFTLPDNLAVTNPKPTETQEIAGNTSGRTSNKGMEGLAITPDGKTLVGIMQANLLDDPVGLVRIVTIDIASGATHEFGYKLTTGKGVSDIVAVNDHEFLVDERDGKGKGDDSKAVVKQVFKIDLAGAVDITTSKFATLGAAPSVTKSGTPFADLVTALTALGIKPADIPAKIEGMTFGQDVDYLGQTYHTLYLANDNDFVPDLAGPNQFFVFGFTDADLARYSAQSVAALPEAQTWMMMIAGFGFIGATMRRRRVSVSFG